MKMFLQKKKEKNQSEYVAGAKLQSANAMQTGVER